MRQCAQLSAAAHAGGLTDVVPRLHWTARSLAHESGQPNPHCSLNARDSYLLWITDNFLIVCTNIEVKA